jgi:hypothetical protein
MCVRRKCRVQAAGSGGIGFLALAAAVRAFVPRTNGGLRELRVWSHLAGNLSCGLHGPQGGLLS